MQHLLKTSLLGLILYFICADTFAQNINYQVRISQLMAEADNADGGGIAGQQDPRWDIWIMDNGTTPGSLTTWQATGCIYTTNNFGSWWTGTPNTGPIIPFNWFTGGATILNTDATTVSAEIEGHEEDGCGGDCDVNPTQTNPFGANFCVNGDDNFDPRGAAGTASFLVDPPCTWSPYIYQNGDYYAELEIYWEYVAIDPGTIDGDQTVCPGNNPTVLGNVLPGTAGTSPHVFYQWQQDIGCTGVFANIPAATSATYTPLPGATQDICYRRSSYDNCGTVFSNNVSVLIEVPSTSPSSIVAMPSSICGSGSATLFVSGGTLGTGGNWVWYNGDPNFGGTLLGMGDPYILTASVTTTVFVRAEGACDTSNTTSAVITIETPTSDPTLVTATNTTVCQGDLVDLTVNGGGLGTSGLWTWYTGDPTASVLVPVYSSATTLYAGVIPLVTTTYYVRAEGCDTSAVAALTIIVNTNSTDATSVTATNPTVCAGSPTTLTVSGGSLGTGADWYWYAGGCGAGAPIANGASAIVNPTTTTTYFVRAEGTCNSTNCASITILVDDLSTDPAAVISSATNVCPGGLAVLSVAGGSLGAGATWEWYTGSCGIGPAGTGTTLAVNPLITTTYFVRAEGTCNTTACASVTVIVDNLSTDPGSINTSSTNICPGGSATLDVLGGSLGPSANWQWYSGSCGGIFVGAGTIIAVTPAVTTTYYVRAEGPCNTTLCTSITIIVDPVSTAPTAVTATNLTVCPGGTSNLTVSGGTLAPSDNWFWYESGCGAGITIGSGTTLTVSPTALTTYFVRAEGPCGNTSCASVTIDMDVVSTDPTSVVATSTALCIGQSTALSVSGGALGTGASWEWYSGSCGGAYLGTGNSISASPTATTTYYVRAEGTCGNSICAQITITVGAGVPDPTAASVTANDICPGVSTNIFVTGAVLPVGYTWVWYTGACGAVPVGVGDTLNVSPTDTTTYYVASVGTCGMTNCEQITVNVLDGSLPATGILSNNNGFCEGGSATLTVDGGYLSPGATWGWYENSCAGTSIGTGTSITVTPFATTTYYVRAEGGTCGNTVCVSIQISVYENHVYLVQFEDICGYADPLELINGVPSGGTYTGTGVSGGFFDPTVAGIGSHAISYTHTNANGCTNTITESINVTPSTLAVEVNIEQLPCAEGGVILDAQVSGGTGYYNFYWSDGEINNPRQFVQEGTYFIVVQDADDCQAVSNPVIITDEMSCIEIPNTITPNGDGKNDTWNIDLSLYGNARLQVFSRWGRIVMESSELQINWDGTSQSGKALPADTYYYVLELDGGSVTQNGPIIILR